MTKRMPAVPPANRNRKGPITASEVASDTSHVNPLGELHQSEQGDTANIMQNTTNKGQFRGGRMK
jgi:hypothetical protein